MNAGTIAHYIEEGKRLLDVGLNEWGIAASVLLIALLSFGLGRLSVLEQGRPLVTVSEAATTSRPAIYLGGEVVASETGAVYYFPWCGGVSAIRQKVWFKSESAAVDEGYRPAKNCKGMQN